MEDGAHRPTFHIMYDALFFAFELHMARHGDLLRQAKEYRLVKAAPAPKTPWWAHLARLLPAAVPVQR